MNNYLMRSIFKNVRIFFILNFFLLIANSNCTFKAEEKPTRNSDYKCNNFSIQKGINVSHWLSQNPYITEEIRNKIFTEEDVRIIANLGFDHIRLPIDEENLWDIHNNKQNESFEVLHKAFGWLQKYNLCLVLDLHQIRSHSFTDTLNALWRSEKESIKFINMWIQLSDEFSKYPNEFLAYEILNEAVAPTAEDWNKLLAQTIDSIRIREPERKLIIGSNRWQSPETFNELVIPENDSNIILSFHFYDPFILTHYRTHWTELSEYSGPVHYPGQTIQNKYLIGYDSILIKKLKEFTTYIDKYVLSQKIQEPIKYANRRNLQLYCGEFGCIPNVHRTDRLKWYSDVCAIFHENKIAYANWDYKGAFSIYNLQTGKPDEKLISILTGYSPN